MLQRAQTALLVVSLQALGAQAQVSAQAALPISTVSQEALALAARQTLSLSAEHRLALATLATLQAVQGHHCPAHHAPLALINP